MSEENCNGSFGEWVSVNSKLPEFDEKVLVMSGGFKCCAILQNVTRSIAKDSPSDKRWFAFPGWGHELESVTAWCKLPDDPR